MRCATLLLALVGCGTLEVHHVMTGPAGNPYGGDVRILLESAPVPDGIEEVAIVQAVGSGHKARLEVLLEGLKGRARQLGCDLIVRVRIDQGATTATASGVAARTPPRAPVPVLVPPQ